MSTIKASGVGTATPVGAAGTNNNAQPFNTMSNEAYEQYQDQAQQAYEAYEDSSEDVKKNARDILKGFMNYVSSGDMSKDAEEIGKKRGLPPKQVAKNFVTKALSILGDLLGIVFNTACNILDTIIDIASKVFHGAVDIIGRAGNGFARVVSLNQTSVA